MSISSKYRRLDFVATESLVPALITVFGHVINCGCFKENVAYKVYRPLITVENELFNQ